MNIQPRIENLSSKKLIGMHQSMSLKNNKTSILWSGFMPRRKEISNNLNTDFISMQLYGPEYFKKFNPAENFEKWAVVEVNGFKNIPEHMETFTLNGGLYAVFDYKGMSNDPSVFQYIFSQWLPQSDYVLDDRPHFEVLGDKYKNNDPNSEEEIWIPIKEK